MKKQLLVVLLALVLAFSLVACIACDETPEQPTTYTLTYAAGEGSGVVPAVENYEAGATVTIKDNLFTAPQGKEFDGWSDGTNKYQSNGSFTMPAHNVTLTAQWKTTTVTPQPEAPAITAAANITIQHDAEATTGWLVLNADGTGTIIVEAKAAEQDGEAASSNPIIQDYITYTLNSNGVLTIAEANYGDIAVPVFGSIAGHTVSITVQSTEGEKAQYKFESEVYKLTVEYGFENSDGVAVTESYLPVGMEKDFTDIERNGYTLKGVKVNGEELSLDEAKKLAMPACDVTVVYEWEKVKPVVNTQANIVLWHETASSIGMIELYDDGTGSVIVIEVINGQQYYALNDSFEYEISEDGVLTITNSLDEEPYLSTPAIGEINGNLISIIVVENYANTPYAFESEVYKYTIDYGYEDEDGISSEIGYYPVGLDLNLTGISERIGYDIQAILVDGEEVSFGDAAEFIMPAYDITITYEWKQVDLPQPENPVITAEANIYFTHESETTFGEMYLQDDGIGYITVSSIDDAENFIIADIFAYEISAEGVLTITESIYGDIRVPAVGAIANNVITITVKDASFVKYTFQSAVNKITYEYGYETESGEAFVEYLPEGYPYNLIEDLEEREGYVLAAVKINGVEVSLEEAAEFEMPAADVIISYEWTAVGDEAGEYTIEIEGQTLTMILDGLGHITGTIVEGDDQTYTLVGNYVICGDAAVVIDKEAKTASVAEPYATYYKHGNTSYELLLYLDDLLWYSVDGSSDWGTYITDDESILIDNINDEIDGIWTFAEEGNVLLGDEDGFAAFVKKYYIVTSQFDSFMGDSNGYWADDNNEIVLIVKLDKLSVIYNNQKCNVVRNYNDTTLKFECNQVTYSIIADGDSLMMFGSDDSSEEYVPYVANPFLGEWISSDGDYRLYFTSTTVYYGDNDGSDAASDDAWQYAHTSYDFIPGDSYIEFSMYGGDWEISYDAENGWLNTKFDDGDERVKDTFTSANFYVGEWINEEYGEKVALVITTTTISFGWYDGNEFVPYDIAYYTFDSEMLSLTNFYNDNWWIEYNAKKKALNVETTNQFDGETAKFVVPTVEYDEMYGTWQGTITYTIGGETKTETLTLVFDGRLSVVSQANVIINGGSFNNVTMTYQKFQQGSMLADAGISGNGVAMIQTDCPSQFGVNRLIFVIKDNGECEVYANNVVTNVSSEELCGTLTKQA